ncbi:MAG TPA: ATP-binding protein [Myxococcales bacterium]
MEPEPIGPALQHPPRTRRRAARLSPITRALRAAARGEAPEPVPVRGDGPSGRLARAANALIARQQELLEVIARAAAGERTVQQDPPLPGQWGTAAARVAHLAWEVGETGAVAAALARGDLSRSMATEGPGVRTLDGEALRRTQAMNSLVRRLGAIRSEVIRIAEEVGSQGRLGGHAHVEGAEGAWKELMDGVNLLASNLTSQVRNIALVTRAVARGDLSQKITVPAHGEILELKETINDMVSQLRAFAAEVTRVAREVGTDGKLGGQAAVPGVSGTWKDLTESVNMLAGNLTAQVRNIAAVTIAVAHGDLSRKITVDARGEILELKSTVNGMVDQLRAFTAEVTRVTREVGSKGMGEQANVPGVAGSWKDLTVSVNQMIVDLGQSTRANEEQDWLKTNLARLSALMQGQAGLEQLSSAILAELCPEVGAQFGSIFVARREKDGPVLERVSGYGLPDTAPRLRFRIGEGLVGQCARERRLLAVEDLPEGYASIRSGTGEAQPRSLILLPLLFQGEVRGVLELASFRAFGAAQRSLLDQLAQMLGVALNTIATSMRSEELLEELRASNAELEKRTAELEEKALQVAQVSRYKTQFLANVSHELRTPLNSLLILAQLLAQNEEGNLSAEQVDHARTILSSGQDLLALINQVLDLSKIESGKMQVDMRPTAIREVIGAVERTLQPMLKDDIAFRVTVGEMVPEWVMTDAQRLQQVLKNLLANAFKFTDHGKVELAVSASREGAPEGKDVVLSFAVSDTGIGIPEDKQALIFEAFQQADASTSRTYGGTGLGLTISRDLAALLGGQLALRSAPGSGSTFTLRLPVEVAPAPPAQEGLRPLRAAGCAEPGKRGPKVLLVDDDGHNLYAVATALEKLGARVVAAQSARDCFALLDENPDVDLVLMDVMMPEMDGLEATRHLRKQANLPDLPVIALTAKALPGDKERCLEAGCSDFATKPVTPESLSDLLRKWGRK